MKTSPGKVNRLQILFLIAMMGTLTTCKKDHLFDCFKSAGKTITETRASSFFSKINVRDNIDLVLVPNSTFSIKVTAGENLIDGIITELNGNTLYIRNENKCNWMRSFKNSYTVEVGFDTIEKIDYYGSGDIDCKDTIRSNEFTFDCWNGSGTINLLFNAYKTHINNNVGRADFHLNGYAGVSYIYLNDVASLDAGNLTTAFTYIRNRSTGDCRINVSEELGAEIDYVGNIYYTGKPHTISQSISGSGRLIEF